MRLANQGIWLWALLLEGVRALFGRRSPPPARLPSPTPDEDLAAQARRCVACGACDAAFDAWRVVPRDEFLGPMHFVLQAGRGPLGWQHLTHVSSLSRGSLVELERVCPTRVPFVSLARTIQAKVPPPSRPAPSTSAQHDPG